ncbi:putative UPF0481 protein [Camellia lanceoleosa]|uniref:UPF0481 protein n=1 Tax=Camellia lanceoleosa TaxID=1840588 RepID=A0ACC0GEU5_9ERIC|nr:putative UPF0481 protein [Camellia lanceoleosa]
MFEIPPIKIRGNSESLFRNLIAYEQCDRQCTDKFTSYAVFLDCLINTSKDADLLCDERIVVLALSTEDVSILFNGLYSDILVYDFYYGGVSMEVNQYYRGHHIQNSNFIHLSENSLSPTKGLVWHGRN